MDRVSKSYMGSTRRHVVFLGPLAVLGLVTLAACMGSPEDAEDDTAAIATDKQRGDAVAFPEAVQILMPNGTDFCTGVLVSPTLVVTAAHCLLTDPTWTSWEVRAPFAPNRRSNATDAGTRADAASSRTDGGADAEAPPAGVTRIGTFNGVVHEDFKKPANGDLGVIKLDAPIQLRTYAKLTDIGARADRGDTFKAVAVGRKTATRNGALVVSKPLTITSALADGYTTGLKSELYSTAGDSGGGLFLLDKDGRVTHAVVGFERDPEPGRSVDYFSRVDPALLRLVTTATTDGGVTRPDGSTGPAPSPTTPPAPDAGSDAGAGGKDAGKPATANPRDDDEDETSSPATTKRSTDDENGGDEDGDDAPQKTTANKKAAAAGGCAIGQRSTSSGLAFGTALVAVAALIRRRRK